MEMSEQAKAELDVLIRRYFNDYNESLFEAGGYESWGTISPHHWRRILRYKKYDKYCDLGSIEVQDWEYILGERPDLVDHCPFHEMDGYDISELLCQSPEFKDRCDLSKLADDDWSHLIFYQHQFIAMCNLDSIDAEYLIRIMEICPEASMILSEDKIEETIYSMSCDRLVGFFWACPEYLGYIDMIKKRFTLNKFKIILNNFEVTI